MNAQVCYYYDIRTTIDDPGTAPRHSGAEAKNSIELVLIKLAYGGLFHKLILRELILLNINNYDCVCVCRY